VGTARLTALLRGAEEENMEASLPVARVLVAAVALIAVASAGIAPAASADPGDRPDKGRGMHDDVRAAHGMAMGPDAARRDPMHAEMGEMHAEMSARLSPEDRPHHERIHEACSGLMTERTER
jgi:hypothetical protein